MVVDRKMKVNKKIVTENILLLFSYLYPPGYSVATLAKTELIYP